MKIKMPQEYLDAISGDIAKIKSMLDEFTLAVDTLLQRLTESGYDDTVNIDILIDGKKIASTVAKRASSVLGKK